MYFECTMVKYIRKNPYEQWPRNLAMSEVSSPDNKQQEQQLCIYNIHFEKSDRDRRTITSVRKEVRVRIHDRYIDVT